MNLAPQAEHLQPYAAERLVAVLVAASRRWIQGATSAAAAAMTAQAAAATAAGQGAGAGRQLGGAGGAGAGGGNGGAVVSENGRDPMAAPGGAIPEVGGGGGGLSDVQELCGEVARVLFLFVWSCTRPRRLGSNVELLYALLHEQVCVVFVAVGLCVYGFGWASAA